MIQLYRGVRFVDSTLIEASQSLGTGHLRNHRGIICSGVGPSIVGRSGVLHRAGLWQSRGRPELMSKPRRRFHDGAGSG